MDVAEAVVGGKVALLVLEHQVPAHNQITLTNYLSRLALRDEELLRTMIKEHQLVTGSELASHVLSYWPHSFKPR